MKPEQKAPAQPKIIGEKQEGDIVSTLRDSFKNYPRTGAGYGGPTMIPNSMGPMIPSQETKLPQGAMATPEDYGPVNTKTGPAAQTTLQETLLAGVEAARTTTSQSSGVGQSEFRNYDRGRPPATPLQNPTHANFYDVELASTGDPHGQVGE